MTLDAEKIEIALRKEGAASCKLELFEELDSTSKHLVRTLDATSDHATSVLCVTSLQTAGVGRRGNTWHSPVDSITLSLRYRFALPAAQLMGLSLVTGIALAEVLGELVSAKIRLKWPNDVIVGDRKLAGILVEIPSADRDSSIVVTGIGINFRHGPEHQKIDQPFVVLESLGGLPERNELIGTVVGRIVNAYERFATHGWSVFAPQWQQFDYLVGQEVRILRGAGTGDTASGEREDVESGVAKGVADDGGLIVNTASGERIYYSGEVSVRPKWLAQPPD